MKILLAVKPDQKAASVAEKVKEELAKTDHWIVESPKLADLILCIGGDGSLLHNIDKYLHYEVPFVGLNAGSLGFLSHLRLASLIQDLEALEAATPKEFATIEASIGNLGKYLAIQDLRIERPDHFPLRVKVTQNGKLIAKRHIGDGFIVTGAIGSTAYNFSAGGPILDLSDHDLLATPICPVPHRNENVDPLTESIRHSNGELVFVAESDARVVFDNRTGIVPAGMPLTVRSGEKSFWLFIERRPSE